MASNTCQICNNNTGKYACPRCNILYCSIDCYKSDQHTECSETFYQKCVQEELSLQEKDPESAKKMLEVLKRQMDMEENSEDENVSLDSDDEEAEPPDLSNRFANVNLDDTDEIWEKLTEEEKKEFKNLLKSGDITKILPEWEPWWLVNKNRPLVCNVDEDFDWKNHCPPVPDDIPPLTELTKAVPSPNVPFILFNILLSYTFTSRWFKGNHDDMPIEATSTILALSASLRNNEIFDNVISSYSKFDSDLKNCKWIEDTEEMKALACEDVFEILEGPKIEQEENFYIKASLSDLNSIFAQAIEEVKLNKQEITERFTGPAPKNSQLKLVAKKIEYYLSWSVSYSSLLKNLLNEFTVNKHLKL